jgi:hypothetical protein
VIWTIVIVCIQLFAYLGAWAQSGHGCFSALIALVLYLSIFVGLFFRTGWGWWLAVGSLSLFGCISLAGLVTDAWWADANRVNRPSVGLVVFSVAFWFVPVILLLVARYKENYLYELEGEDPKNRPMPSAPAKPCKRCGNPCSKIENVWSKAGVCSKKCMVAN